MDRELLSAIVSDPLLASGFLAGGPVRDALLAREPEDIDIVLPRGAVEAAKEVASRYGGRWVPLHLEEGVSRVVLPGLVVDFSQFRGRSSTIEDDLALRDFTINAMAVPMRLASPLLLGEARKVCLIDPLNGRRDCRDGLVRAIGRSSFEADPLRLLRAFRFAAQLGFSVDAATLVWVQELAASISAVAAERIWHELSLLTITPRAGQTFRDMHRHGLLGLLIPELMEMEGVEQPGFHHLDVFWHCMEALRMAEALIQDPGRKLDPAGPVEQWCRSPRNVLALKWAALLHDVAKPVCKGRKGERVTFYRHDHAGSEMAAQIGSRLRWPGQLLRQVQALVRLHMRPFHLLGDMTRGGPTKRAMRRLLKETGEDYPGLFALAMADSMAGCGPMKPADLDHRLNLLWAKVHHFYLRLMKPVEESPRLLDGHDVMSILGVGPGPRIGAVLEALELARLEGKVSTREEAEEWVRRHGATVFVS